MNWHPPHSAPTTIGATLTRHSPELPQAYLDLQSRNAFRLHAVRDEMGVRLCTHPDYKPRPHHALSHRTSAVLAPIAASARKAGRI